MAGELGKPANRFYRGGKISEYQFRRILAGFAADLPPSQLASRMTLSLNSIAAIYQRLRAHYVRIGVFRNFYEDLEDPTDTASESYELELLEFHRARIGRMRGVKADPVGSDHHFRESCWRFQVEPFFEGRAPETVHAMIFAELFAYLKFGGPIGADTPDMLAIRQCQLQFLDRRVAWLERSSVEFSADDVRQSLKAIRSL